MIALSRLRVQPYIVIKRGKYIKANRENNIMNREQEKISSGVFVHTRMEILIELW